MLIWLKISQQPIDSVIIIPIVFSLNYREYTKEVVAPESANFVAVTIVTLPGKTILADDVTLDGPGLGWGMEETQDLKLKTQKLEVYPNPCIYNATIKYFVPHNSFVKIKVYDIKGCLVNVLVDSQKQRGNYSLTWDRKDINGNLIRMGVYFCLFECGVQDKQRN